MVENPINLIFVSDRQILSESLCSSLQSDSELSPNALCGKDDSVLSYLQTSETEVIVLDSQRIDFLPVLRNKKNNTPVLLFFTDPPSHGVLVHAKRFSATGFIAPSRSLQDLKEAIKMIAQKQRESFTSGIGTSGRLNGEPYFRIDDVQESPLDQLTPRQLQILRILASGATVKEAARSLHLSPKAIDSHKYRIMQKLGIHDRVKLSLFAIREGLITA
jgi:DNA-binding NarL/FixJ family response regulator